MIELEEILELLADGVTSDEIVETYPELFAAQTWTPSTDSAGLQRNLSLPLLPAPRET